MEKGKGNLDERFRVKALLFRSGCSGACSIKLYRSVILAVFESANIFLSKKIKFHSINTLAY